MTLSVEPSALSGYAAMLGRARDDAQQCKTYFSQNVADLELTDGGLLNPLYYEHIRVKRRLDEMLNQLVTLLSSSHDQLALAATRYRDTDDEIADRIDNTYPEVPRIQPRTD
jgi:uncharacterized protein YukE